MSKWDYKIITRERKIKFLSGAQWDIDIESMLPELGEEGWELINVIPLSSQYGDSYAGFTTEEKWIFKKARQ